MKATVRVMLKEGVLDPQGKAIAGALTGLGFAGVADVRAGKLIELTLDGDPSEAEARDRVAEMCRRLLANPVIEDWRIEALDRG